MSIRSAKGQRGSMPVMLEGGLDLSKPRLDAGASVVKDAKGACERSDVLDRATKRPLKLYRPKTPRSCFGTPAASVVFPIEA